jgi:uncharacterized membrane protein
MEEPVWQGIGATPQGVLLDSAENINRNASLIRVNAVLSRAMPPGNVTDMTAEERRILAAWLNGAAGR